ncbi:hypothetical protein [Argonema antarcticum]|uniref:hypothetical protein n=1 Tax=Argonema antarcticum TaxID=2942763 RepID=UPI0020110D9A|nr:hypothetical protein [Argonema antarcticum]MCL1470300.1 hypothetical protein [Argonema antarcticum A004/B2]
MKHLVTTFGIISTLLLAQGCSSTVKSGEAVKSGETSDSVAIKQHEGHLMDKGETPVVASDPHAGHSMHNNMDHGNNSAQAKALFSDRKNIQPNQPVVLGINIQDSKGKAITKFDTFQEKIMHLIVVSDDLQFFDHLHPTYKQNGRFEVTANFPRSGQYTFFADYKPSGQNEQVSVLKKGVPGATPSAPAIDLNTAKTFGDTKVNITFSKPKLKAGEEVHAIFNLKNTSNNQPVTNLQPYLGERGHLVIVKQSSNLTKADYIHAHAMKHDSGGEVHFMTKFPQPGKYKLWGQFNRNGKVVTADFWVNVQ